MKNIFEKLINFIFPTECLACRKTGPDICNECLQALRPAKRRKRERRWITSLGNYRDPRIKKIMYHIKNQPNRRAARIIARAFSEIIANRPRDLAVWICIPIPISKKRWRERGYNQSELLARPLGQALTIPVLPNILYKTKHTKKQGTAKSKEDRLQNITGSFGVRNADIIKDKNIMIVDDITTTGTTLGEARKTLLEAGARKVLAITVAN